MAEDEQPYEVGYGKPPRATQFQKGRSGNPKGRPRGSRNLARIVLKESRERVQINGARGRRTVTKLEAALMQLTNKSAQGDLRATRELLPLVAKSEESVAAGSSSLAFSELDQKVLEGLQRRLSNAQRGTTQSGEETTK